MVSPEPCRELVSRRRGGSHQAQKGLCPRREMERSLELQAGPFPLAGRVRGPVT